MKFHDLNLRTRRTLGAIWAVGVLGLVWAVVWPLSHGRLPGFSPEVLVLIAAATLADLFPVVFEERYEITVSTVFWVAAVLIFSTRPEMAIAVPLISSLISNLISRKPWFKAVTNVAMAVSGVAVAALVFNLVGQQDWRHLVLATACLLAVYFAADTVPMTLVLSALEDRPFRVVYEHNHRTVLLQIFGMQIFGVLLAILWSVSPWLIFLFLIPTIILRQAYFQADRLRTQSITVLGALADVIENRDAYTHNHTQSVSSKARRLAEKMGLSADDVFHVAIAGQLHDLGKIAVSDTILLKPDRLTPEEMRKMEAHCQVGYDLLAHFTGLLPVAEMVRAHHERYDGQGYPRHLAGATVPIGAAIIAVADAFDAMTTDRPYRKAMPVEKALDILRQGLGTQWHPVAGATFIQMTLEDAAAQQRESAILQLPNVAA